MILCVTFAAIDCARQIENQQIGMEVFDFVDLDNTINRLDKFFNLLII